ncbi:hypothetical protein [Bacillus sp. NTK074B]|uniref:hypothetical protein n=1 Tax=Bacillus sp. NTK074B TaxID=2802174 RepID=UPI001FD27203
MRTIRMDHVSINVNDLPKAKEFFLDIGLEVPLIKKQKTTPGRFSWGPFYLSQDCICIWWERFMFSFFKEGRVDGIH